MTKQYGMSLLDELGTFRHNGSWDSTKLRKVQIWIKCDIASSFEKKKKKIKLKTNLQQIIFQALIIISTVFSHQIAFFLPEFTFVRSFFPLCITQNIFIAFEIVTANYRNQREIN